MVFKMRPCRLRCQRRVIESCLTNHVDAGKVGMRALERFDRWGDKHRSVVIHAVEAHHGVGV